ncbi:hypothetical protein E4U35_008174 [Claviceps purpurea]|nr:hypothetical protein E4U35_008174 [Claviceps purpurea]
MKVAVVLSLVTAVLANKHWYCGCAVSGKYKPDLSEFACADWATLFPNTHFDGNSCVDKGIGRGIEGDVWEKVCARNWGPAYGGKKEDVRGNCW